MIQTSPNWKKQLPEAYVGLLVLKNAPNLPDHPDLQIARVALEGELRSLYGDLDRKALREEPVLAAYDSFYRRFRKTYHVQLQLESVVFQGKEIKAPSALVACMFMAELSTGLLTAAHNFKALELPLTAKVATGDETYQRLNGSQQQLKEGDMYINDQIGILSSVIYGPDQRTQIGPDTDQAAYTTYAPTGISESQVKEQLELLESYVRLIAPDVERELLVIV